MNRWWMACALLTAASSCVPDHASQTIEVNVETESGRRPPDGGFFIQVPPEVLDETLDVLHGDRIRLARHLSVRSLDTIALTNEVSLWAEDEGSYTVRIVGFWSETPNAPPTERCLSLGDVCEPAEVGPPEGAREAMRDVTLAFERDSPGILDPVEVRVLVPDSEIQDR